MQFDHIYDFQVFVLSMDDPRFIAKVIKQSKSGKVAIVMTYELATTGWADQWIPKAMCHNPNIVWIHSCYDDSYYDTLRESKGINFKMLPENVSLLPVIYFTVDKIQHEKTNADKLFAFMNGKPRYHRAQLIDKLYQADLFKNGYITWRTFEYISCENYVEGESYKTNRRVFYPIQDYEFQHWTPTTMLYQDKKLTSNSLVQTVSNKTGYPDQTIPDEIHKSFLVLQSETDLDTPNLSEKTYKCLYWKKPFIIAGPHKLHAHLESQGYKLPSVINYSFDTEPNVNIRIQMIIKELQRLSKLDLNKLNEQVQDVVEHNYCLFMENLQTCDDSLNFSQIYKTTEVDHQAQAMVQNIKYE